MAQGTRDRIVVAARHLFLTHGLGHVGLDQIVQQAGLTKTTFYNYFESKEDLITEVIDFNERGMRSRLVEAATEIAGDDARRRLVALFEVLGHRDGHPRDSAYLMLSAAAQHPNPRDPINKVAMRNSVELARLIEQFAVEAGVAEPKQIAKQFAILMYGASVFGSLSKSPHTAADHAREVAQRLLEAEFS